MESLEILERIANPQEPPLQMEDIEKKRDEVLQAGDNLAPLKNGLDGMEKAFKGRGDLTDWSYELLGLIDDCFVKHYMDDGEPVNSLFTPDCPDNFNRFAKYCCDVDEVLRTSADAPTYCREYFTFYSIWQLRGYGFPVPLGTASVVDCLHKICSKLRNGFVEVSIHLIRLDARRSLLCRA